MSRYAHPFDPEGAYVPSPWSVGSSPQASFALEEVHGCVVVVAAGEIDICATRKLRTPVRSTVGDFRHRRRGARHAPREPELTG